MAYSVVIDDFDGVGAALAPHETQAPLIVDTDAVLSFPVSAQGLKAIPGWNPQVIQSVSRVQHFQLAPGHRLERLEAPNRFSMEEPLSVPTTEGADHAA
jgi:hypothetical protein